MPTTANPLSPTRPGDTHAWSETLIPTAREAPADAELPSHVWLSRAGYIRRVGAGIYIYMPLAQRVLRKIEAIVRAEMDAHGARELLMPALNPIELYAGSKRDVDYGDLLFKVEDRHGRTAALGPTHEECITDMMLASVTSYKQLPLNLYQVQTKFRDEFRPRAGLLRCREFIMKDAYSFHLELEGDAGLNATYDKMYQAYVNVFTRCGLDFSVVEAESGPIGGSASHEFMVNCDSGEDTILHCPASGYTANVEKCEIGERSWSFDSGGAENSRGAEADLQTHHTPGMPGIDAVADHLGVTPAQMLKTVLFEPADQSEDETDNLDYILTVVRGDHEVNEGKVRDAAGTKVTLADPAKAKAAGYSIGYVSPRAAAGKPNVLTLIDPDACGAPDGGWATGADKADHHDTGFHWPRDLGTDLPTPESNAGPVRVASIRNALAGDPSPRDASSTLIERRGIEVGHIFKLGTKYSDAMSFQIMDKTQKRQPVIMGCYGLGVSRTMAACVEQSCDDNGIVWPAPIAPYHVLIVLIKPEDEASRAAAKTITDELAAAGVDTLIDDRKERPGVKFKDADIIGIPLRLTIGPKTLDHGGVEFKQRGSAEDAAIIKTEEAAAQCKAVLN